MELSAGRQSHLIFAKFLRIKAFEPLLKPLIIRGLRGEVGGSGAFDDGLFYKDRRPGPECQGNGIARTGINSYSLAAHGEVDHSEVSVVLEVANHDAIDPPLEVGDDVPEQVVGHRARRRDVLDLQRNGIRLGDTDPDWKHPLALLVLQDNDRRTRHWVNHQTLDAHFNQHDRVSMRGATQDTASPDRLCGPDRVTRTVTMRPIQSAAASLCEVSDGIGRFTTVLPDVRPESSWSFRRPTESTRTPTIAHTAFSLKRNRNDRC